MFQSPSLYLYPIPILRNPYVIHYLYHWRIIMSYKVTFSTYAGMDHEFVIGAAVNLDEFAEDLMDTYDVIPESLFAVPQA